MSKINVTLVRKNSKRYKSISVRKQIDYIIKRTTSGARSVWKCKTYSTPSPTQVEDGWRYQVVLTFERQVKRKKPNQVRLNTEMGIVIGVLKEVCTLSKFGIHPWYMVHHESDWNGNVPKTVSAVVADPVNIPAPDPQSQGMNADDVVDFSKAVPLEEIDIPEVLISGSDDEIENHPAFEGIYGRAAHIRVMFSSIKTMKDTQGQRRNHVILHGLPGCAKSSLFLGMKKILPKGSYLFMNANSATRAGVEAVFLNRLKVTGVPPFMFLEEIEKTLEAILTVWLSILDDRGEVRKITHGEAKRTDARVLCFATANDKVLFDGLMGGRRGHPGALSSRFTKPLYVPRPSWQVMERILLRDIAKFGGKNEWAAKAIEIAQEMKTDDPRIVLSFLDGGDRLMNGAYKQDIMTIHAMENEDRKSDKAIEEVGDSK